MTLRVPSGRSGLSPTPPDVPARPGASGRRYGYVWWSCWSPGLRRRGMVDGGGVPRQRASSSTVTTRSRSTTGRAVDEQQLQRRRASRAPARRPGRRCRRGRACRAATAPGRPACPARASRSVVLAAEDPGAAERGQLQRVADRQRLRAAAWRGRTAPRGAASSSSCAASLRRGAVDAEPDRAPASTGRGSGRCRRPSRALDDGQWATPVPVSPSRATAASSRCMPWANHTSVAEPAQRLDVLHRGAAEPLPAEVLLVEGLGEVGVQADTRAAGERRRPRSAARR